MNILRNVSRLALLALLPLLTLPAGCQFDQATLDTAMRTTQQVIAAQSGASREDTIAAGLKEALSIGSERAAKTLSKTGGYGDNPLLRIALPQDLQPVADTLRKAGMGRYVDDVETDMNRAAELAAAKAVPIFKDAVTGMTLSDVMGIFNGGDKAATKYFRGKTEGALRKQFSPVIQSSLQQTGYYDSYKSLLNTYNRLPIADKPSLDLEQHILDRSLDGLFTTLADEEKAIRQDPVKRTTELLKKVFGGGV